MAMVSINLTDLMEYLVGEVRKELTKQGHRLTGKLVDSVEAKESKITDGWVQEVFWEKYGEAMERGVRPSRVPFSPGSGAVRSKYIEGLLRFVKLRGMRPRRKGETQLGIAFAIARTQKERGLPTVGSRAYSQTGRRTGATGEVLAREKTKIRKGVEEAALVYVEATMVAALEDIVKSGKFIFIS